MLINRGWDLKKLQYWLGHSDTQTTLNIYAHFNRQQLNTSENDLSEISNKASDLFAWLDFGNVLGNAFKLPYLWQYTKNKKEPETL